MRPGKCFAIIPKKRLPRARKSAGRAPPGFLRKFLAECPDRAARADAYFRALQACAEPDAPLSNIALAQKILKLRAEVSQACAYSPYSKAIFFHKAEKSPERIKQFLAQTGDQLRPAATAQIAQLAEFAARTQGIKNFAPWDLLWILPQFTQETFGGTGPPLAGRFPVAHAVPGVIALAEKLFALKFEPQPHEPNTFLVIPAETATPAGVVRVQLDATTARGPFFSARGLAAEKFSWADQQLKLPVVELTCTPPEAQGPEPRLSLTGLVDLFHEMGHTVEMLFFNETCAGIRRQRYPTDVIEFSSKFMEQFALSWEHIRGWATPDATGAALSPAEFARACAQYRFENTLTNMELFQHSLLDLEIGLGAPTRLRSTLRAARAQINFPAGLEINVYTDRNIFGPMARMPLRVPNYTTNLYTYLLSEALAQKTFAMFEASGQLVNPVLGQRLRTEVFAHMDNFAAAYKNLTGQLELLPELPGKAASTRDSRERA